MKYTIKDVAVWVAVSSLALAFFLHLQHVEQQNARHQEEIKHLVANMAFENLVQRVHDNFRNQGDTLIPQKSDFGRNAGGGWFTVTYHYVINTKTERSTNGIFADRLSPFYRHQGLSTGGIHWERSIAPELIHSGELPTEGPVEVRMEYSFPR